MSVGYDLGTVECLFQIVNKLLFVAFKRFFSRTGDNLASASALILDSRKATSEDSLADQSDYTCQACLRALHDEDTPGTPVSNAFMAVHLPVPF